MADINIVNEVDGEFYVAGSSGEIEEDKAYRHVIVLNGDSNIFLLGTATDTTPQAAKDAINRTIRLNYWHLLSTTSRDKITLEIARRVAYARVLALCKGLGDTNDNNAARNLQYNDVKKVAVGTAVTWNDGTADLLVEDPEEELIPNLVEDLEWRKDFKLKFTNVVCIIAYFFRVRGHHWIEDMDERYKAVWRRCLYQEDTPELDWEFLAHHALHFIYPDILDQFWTDAKNNARCAGTLVKRWDSLPAGVAAVGAVRQGAYDLLVVFPAFRVIMPEAFTELDRCIRAIGARSWVGSINRRFYNANDLIVDERALGALASVILVALSNAANAAPLANSDALKRVADNAPITGNMLAQVMQKATQDDRMVDAFFLEEMEEETKT